MALVADQSNMRKQYHFWPSVTGEGLDAWDVDRLIELSESLPSERVALESIAEIESVYWFDDVHRPTVRAVVEHSRLIDEVDMSFAIILGPDGRVMDGMHRIGRALRDGATYITAHRFQELPPPDHFGVQPHQLSYGRPT